MTHEPVESSAIKSIGYDEEKKTFEVRIQDTDELYQYYNVPREEYFAFISQPSKGTYYNKVFKTRYPDYKRLS